AGGLEDVLALADEIAAATGGGGRRLRRGRLGRRRRRRRWWSGRCSGRRPREPGDGGHVGGDVVGVVAGDELGRHPGDLLFDPVQADVEAGRVRAGALWTPPVPHPEETSTRANVAAITCARRCFDPLKATFTACPRARGTRANPSPVRAGV